MLVCLDSPLGASPKHGTTGQTEIFKKLNCQPVVCGIVRVYEITHVYSGENMIREKVVD